MSGAFNPAPFKAGGTSTTIEEAILEGLLEADGTALAKDVSTFVWAERFAESRAIAYLWHFNRRMANQWDPSRMTDFLPRWETILGLLPSYGAAASDRRVAVRAKLSLDGQPGTLQVVNDLMGQLLGPLYAGIVNTTSAAALGYVPGGIAIPGGVTLAEGPWSSTIAHVVILAVQPDGTTDAVFYAALGQLGQYLDDLLPAWCAWDWARDGAGGAGFVLDDDHNLDNERFDT